MTTKIKIIQLKHQRNRLMKRILDHQATIEIIDAQIYQLEKYDDTTR